MALGPAADQGEGEAGPAQLSSRGLNAPRPRPQMVRDGAEAGGTGAGCELELRACTHVSDGPALK